MEYDLVIRNGTVIDGTGAPRYEADVAVIGDTIAAIGKIGEKGRTEIDAKGLLITPGFVDGHTHYDAQVFWDTEGSCSSWNGITTVVMGSCGFTLAPSRPGEHDLVVSNLERAEDIPASALSAGINWTWETFPEYLDAVEARPKAINYACHIGHSALRTFAMSERALTDQSSPEELAVMEETLREALRAGAVGFTSSTNEGDCRVDGSPVASRLASRDELEHLVRVMADEGGGIFECSWGDRTGRTKPDPWGGKEFWDWLKNLLIETKIPHTYVLQFGALPGTDEAGVKVSKAERMKQHMDVQFQVMDEITDGGGEIFAQTLTHGGSMYCFRALTPWDRIPGWVEFRALSHEEQLAGLSDPEVRKTLIEPVKNAWATGKINLALMKTTNRPLEPLPGYHELVVQRPGMPTTTVEAIAAERGIDGIECVLDLALESGLDLVFSHWAQPAILEYTLHHRNTVMTDSDSGAHVRYHSGAELQMRLLTEWVKERKSFTMEEAIREITWIPARCWRFYDRGLLRVGMKADINVLDYDKIEVLPPTSVNDLPGGSWRIHQRTAGIRHTFCNGVETFRDGQFTGAIPGVLIRRQAPNAQPPLAIAAE